MTRSQTFAIVGAGQAGGWTAKTLRDEGFEGRIVLVSDEPYPPHERPPLSKEVLLGDAEHDTCFLWADEILKEANIDMYLGVTATDVDQSAHSLTLDNGEVIEWDKLMLATGGRARTLPAQGSDLDGVHTLRTIEDSAAIRARLSKTSKVLIIGAGWIGLEVAAAAKKKVATPAHPIVVIKIKALRP